MDPFTAFCSSMIYEEKGAEARFKDIWKAYNLWWATIGSIAFPKHVMLRLHEFTKAFNAQFGVPHDGINYRNWTLRVT